MSIMSFAVMSIVVFVLASYAAVKADKTTNAR